MLSWTGRSCSALSVASCGEDAVLTVARNSHLVTCTKGLQKLLKSELTSIKAYEGRLSSIRSHQSEIWQELRFSFWDGSAFTAFNYSVLRETRLVPYHFWSDRVEVLSLLPICPATSKIEADIENFPEDKSSDGIGALSISLQNLAQKPAHERSRNFQLFQRMEPFT